MLFKQVLGKKKKKEKPEISEYLIDFHSFFFSFVYSLPYRKAKHELLRNIVQQLNIALYFTIFKNCLTQNSLSLLCLIQLIDLRLDGLHPS